MSNRRRSTIKRHIYKGGKGKTRREKQRKRGVIITLHDQKSWKLNHRKNSAKRVRRRAVRSTRYETKRNVLGPNRLEN